MSRFLRHVGTLIVIACLATAMPAAATSQFESTLLKLADRALDEGDLKSAKERYQRVLSSNSDSARANAGLGRVHLALGDLSSAESNFERALAVDATLVMAQQGLAEVAIAKGDIALARERLDALVPLAPLDPIVHQLRFELTGMGSKGDVEKLKSGRVTPKEVKALAAAHPYDPRMQMALAFVAEYEGDVRAARTAARAALMTADLAPHIAVPATRLLTKLENGQRRIVAVHLYADETVREKPGWKFELRIAWARAAATLEPLLHTVFAPISIHKFVSGNVPDDLGAIKEAMLSSEDSMPPGGILSGFTRRESPRTRLASRLGQAKYLGREMLVRLDPEELDARTLIHEVLHLYGAIHLSANVETVMNPIGGEMRLDQFNAAIVRLTAKRRFSSASIEENVLDRLDKSALADALIAALAVNIHFRAIGIEEILKKARGSRVAAAPIAEEVVGQDQHLAQVAFLTAQVLILSERAAEAVSMMRQSAQLYGPRSKEGRAATQTANNWRKHYKSFLAN